MMKQMKTNNAFIGGSPKKSVVSPERNLFREMSETMQLDIRKQVVIVFFDLAASSAV